MSAVILVRRPSARHRASRGTQTPDCPPAGIRKTKRYISRACSRPFGSIFSAVPVLPGDRKAGDLRQRRRAARADHALQRMRHLLRRLGGNHPPDFHRRKTRDHLPFVVRDVVDDLRHHQMPAVRDRAQRRDRLQRRHRHLLAHRDARDRELAPLVRRIHQPRDLARKRDPRALAEIRTAGCIRKIAARRDPSPASRRRCCSISPGCRRPSNPRRDGDRAGIARRS